MLAGGAEPGASALARAELESGIAALQLELPHGAMEKMLAYLELLAKWNRTYNLTAVRDGVAMVRQHLLDSLAVLPHLDPPGGELPSLLDLGSGAGLPGIPLALARPGLAVALIESNQKKTAFLQQAKIAIGLPNVSIHCRRAESWQPPCPFAAVIARAYADLRHFVLVAAHLVAEGGRLLAMKGKFPAAEAQDLPAGWRQSAAIPLTVPGLAAARYLVVIERA